MRHLLLCGLFFLVAFSADAQRAKGNYNFLDFQQKPYYFGITLASNTSNFKILRSKDFIMSDSINTAEAVTGPGFNLGIVTNLKVGNYFDFRFLPTLSFAERRIEYTLERRTDDLERSRFEHVFVEMPFHIRYKSEPYKDMRLFMIGGVKYSFDVASNSRARQANELVKIAPTDFAFEVGAGIQFFFPYFIFSPEFKYSQGIGDVLIYDDRLEKSSVLDKILSRTFTISLHFEG
ncbi:MAG: outer membrane beta-barrel protein [Saprospiraceae bacterium]